VSAPLELTEKSRVRTEIVDVEESAKLDADGLPIAQLAAMPGPIVLQITAVDPF
jgi:hypothetical protein